MLDNVYQHEQIIYVVTLIIVIIQSTEAEYDGMLVVTFKLHTISNVL